MSVASVKWASVLSSSTGEMNTTVCFKIVIKCKCKISTYWRFKFKDFSSTFKYSICFPAFSRALKLFVKINFLRINMDGWMDGKFKHFKDFSSTLWTLKKAELPQGRTTRCCCKFTRATLQWCVTCVLILSLKYGYYGVGATGSV